MVSYSVMFRNVYGMRFRIGLRVYRFRGAAIAYDVEQCRVLPSAAR